MTCVQIYEKQRFQRLQCSLRPPRPHCAGLQGFQLVGGGRNKTCQDGWCTCVHVFTLCRLVEYLYLSSPFIRINFILFTLTLHEINTSGRGGNSDMIVLTRIRLRLMIVVIMKMTDPLNMIAAAVPCEVARDPSRGHQHCCLAFFTRHPPPPSQGGFPPPYPRPSPPFPLLIAPVQKL